MTCSHFTNHSPNAVEIAELSTLLPHNPEKLPLLGISDVEGPVCSNNIACSFVSKLLHLYRYVNSYLSTPEDDWSIVSTSLRGLRQ